MLAHRFPLTKTVAAVCADKNALQFPVGHIYPSFEVGLKGICCASQPRALNSAVCLRRLWGGLVTLIHLTGSLQGALTPCGLFVFYSFAINFLTCIFATELNNASGHLCGIVVSVFLWSAQRSQLNDLCGPFKIAVTKACKSFYIPWR